MSWGELVTTALLGTTRRPPTPGWQPDGSWARSLPATEDPALRLLDLAAAHRAVDLLGENPASVPPGQVAPEQHHPVAPAAAVAVLDELAARPEPSLISFWLQQCVIHRRTAAPVHWTFLARAAARSTRYDRATLGRAMGEAGRWFLRQNPEWRRLGADATAGALTPAPPAERSGPRSSAPLTDEQAGDPDQLLARPDPWPAEVATAAWVLIGAADLGVRLTGFAAEVGLRMPAELYPRLGEAARFYLEAPEASPAQRRAIRHGFMAVEQAAYARARIAAAFAEDPIELDRVEIPHV